MRDFQTPDRIEITEGPTGQLVTVEQAGFHLDDVDVLSDPKVVADIERLIGAAMEYVEDALRYSFRRRTLRATFREARDIDAWLYPWGPALDPSVTADGQPLTGFRQRHEWLVTILCADADEFTVEWQVGSAEAWPASVQQVVLRVVDAMWNDRSGANPLPDPKKLLQRYNLNSGWA